MDRDRCAVTGVGLYGSRLAVSRVGDVLLRCIDAVTEQMGPLPARHPEWRWSGWRALLGQTGLATATTQTTCA